MGKLCFMLTCFFFVLAVSAPVNAEQPARDRVFIDTGIDHTFKARIRGTDTEISTSRYSIKGSYSNFILSYDYTDYSWDRDGDAGLGTGAGDPWTGLHNISLGARKNFFLNPEWILSLGGGVNTAFEKELSDSFGARADFSFIRIINRNWSTGIGAIGLYHPVRSRVLPVLTISYTSAVDHGLSLRLGFPETNIRYEFNDKLAAKTYFSYSGRIYRLKNDSRVQEKGYFRDRSFRIGMEVEAKPVRAMAITVGSYYLFEREWEIYNKNKNRSQKERIGNTPGINMNLSWNF